MLNLCSIVVAILKMATGRNFSMSGINSGHHYLPTYKILMISDNVEFLPPIFYAVFWQPFWKWQTSRKFYVSIIIHLEVININVRNFNFPIGFYSNPHPLWTPQNMTLTPFTTKLKTLGPSHIWDSWTTMAHFCQIYLSTLLHPLHKLLRKEEKWEWSEECEQAFEKSKQN